MADANRGEPGARPRIQRPPEVLEALAARLDRSVRGRILDPRPADVARTSGVGEGADSSDMGSYIQVIGTPAHRFSFAIRGRHGASGDRQSHRTHRRNS